MSVPISEFTPSLSEPLFENIEDMAHMVDLADVLIRRAVWAARRSTDSWSPAILAAFRQRAPRRL
jgi:hypothetical protein